jgi:aldose 1-epimerase
MRHCTLEEMSVQPFREQPGAAVGEGPGAREGGGLSPEPPSGRQLRLVHGDQEAVVTETGATLRSYTVGGRPVIAGFAESEVCPAARGQLLLPWPNRIGDGRYSFGGSEHQLPIDEPERGNAIHGLTRWVGWLGEPSSPARLVMRHRLLARPGYPHRLDLSAAYELDGSGLRVTVTAVNVGASTAPFGAGAHPYVQAGAPLIDGCLLRVPASTALRTDFRSLPAGRVPVEGTGLDFRRPRAIGDTPLDTPYTDLLRDPDGLARVSLQAPSGRRVVVWCDAAHRWLQIFSGDGLSSAGRRTALAIEPMTCPPDAFRSGEDLIVLGPGESFTGTWGIDITAFREEGGRA